MPLSEKKHENLPGKLTSKGFSGIAAKAESLGAVSIARMPLKATVQACYKYLLC